jgi:hypothetical protein
MQLEIFEREQQYKVCHMTKAGEYRETKHPLNLPSAKRYLKFLLDACPWIQQAWIDEIKKAEQSARLDSANLI